MRRRFNITGSCIPERHYMVRLDNRLKKIKEDFVDYGSYFVINRGRQYGKTTTLRALEEYLKEDYLVLSLDFQQIVTEDFIDGPAFVRAFSKKLFAEFGNIGPGDSQNMQEMLSDFRDHNAEAGLDDLFVCLSRICEKSTRPIVLIIDEVDSTSNNQVFIRNSRKLIPTTFALIYFNQS